MPLNKQIADNPSCQCYSYSVFILFQSEMHEAGMLNS